MAKRGEKGSSIWSIDLKAGSGKKSIRYPDKTTINLVRSDSGKKRRRVLLLSAVCIVLFVLFARFAVYDQLNKLLAAQEEYGKVQTQVQSLQLSNARYNQVKAEYDSVTDWYLTDEEKLIPDKMDIFDMIEDDIEPYVGIRQIQIAGDTVSVTTGETTLDVVAQFLSKLQEDTRNASATVTTTSASSSKESGGISASIIIQYVGERTVEEETGLTEEEKQAMLEQLLAESEE